MTEDNDEGLAPIEVPAKRANEDKLGSLHGVVAEYLTLAIASGKCPPAIIGAAITFLKNNNITADAVKNERLAALKDTLAGKRNRNGGLTQKGLEEANNAFAGLMGDMGLPQ